MRKHIIWLAMIAVLISGLFYTWAYADGPAPPTNLRGVAVSPTSIKLDWDCSYVPSGGYGVWRVVYNADGNFASQGDIVKGLDKKTYTDTGLTPDRKYVYNVYCITPDRKPDYPRSGPSNSITVWTSSQMLVAPSNLIATAVSPSQINITWQDNSYNESGFKIQGLNYSNSTVPLPTTIVGPNNTSYQHSGLSPNTEITYYLWAYKGEEHSETISARAKTWLIYSISGKVTEQKVGFS